MLKRLTLTAALLLASTPPLMAEDCQAELPVVRAALLEDPMRQFLELRSVQISQRPSWVGWPCTGVFTTERGAYAVTFKTENGRMRLRISLSPFCGTSNRPDCIL
jgi:hypothetical protein